MNCDQLMAYDGGPSRSRSKSVEAGISNLILWKRNRYLNQAGRAVANCQPMTISARESRRIAGLRIDRTDLPLHLGEPAPVSDGRVGSLPASGSMVLCGSELPVRPVWIAMGCPHSGQRSGLARRSYPHFVQRPCLARRRCRQCRTNPLNDQQVSSASNRATGQYGTLTPVIEMRSPLSCSVPCHAPMANRPCRM